MVDLPGATFARRLREVRRSVDMSQAELAERVSERLGTTIDGTAVTRIEKHVRAVKLDEAVALADVLEVPLVALMTEPDAVLVELERAREDLLVTEAAMTRASRNLDQWSVDAARLRRRIAELEALRAR